jgi:DNA-3-methyladenine glycosylase
VRGKPTLSRSFYERPTLQVARELLGAILVHRLPDGRRLAGRIRETEAYIGDDAASHARTGPAGRAAVMFGEAARAYVYLIYGMHHCFNIVTERVGFPAAVLVRAVEPRESASGRRASGPGLVCRALEIDRTLNGVDLTTGERLFVEEGEPVPDSAVGVGPRIGVAYSGTWAEMPWRFWTASST